MNTPKSTVLVLLSMITAANCATAAAELTFYTIGQQFAPQTLEKITYDGSSAPVVTVVGNINPSSPSTKIFSFGGLAWDSNNNTLYMIDGFQNSVASLYTINISTGAATLVGSTGVGSIDGLGYDSKTNQLFAYQAGGGTSNGLFQIALNGTATLVGRSSEEISGLAYNPQTDQLVGTVGNGGLYSIDITSGALTELSATSGALNNSGTVYDPTSGDYYGIDTSRDFYTVDGSTYAVNYISNNITSPRSDGLALVSGAVPEPSSAMQLAAGSLIALFGVRGIMRNQRRARL